MTRFTHFVGEGEYIPWGWGVSFRDFERDTKVCHPIPLHLLRRWARDIRFWLMAVGRPGYRERVEHAAWLKGRRTGERLLTEMCETAYERGVIDGEVRYIRRTQRSV